MSLIFCLALAKNDGKLKEGSSLCFGAQPAASYLLRNCVNGNLTTAPYSLQSFLNIKRPKSKLYEGSTLSFS